MTSQSGMPSKVNTNVSGGLANPYYGKAKSRAQVTLEVHKADLRIAGVMTSYSS